MAGTSTEDLAKYLYEQCLQAPSDHLFNNADLLEYLPRPDKKLLVEVNNYLLSRGLLRALRQGDAVVYKVVKKEEADK